MSEGVTATVRGGRAVSRGLSEHFVERAMIDGYWSRAPLPAKLSLGVALAAAGLNLASYAGLGMDRPFFLYALLHVGVIVLGVWVVARIFRLNGLRWRGAPAGPPGPRYPPVLWGALVVAVVYFAAVTLMLVAGGEGGPEIVDGRPAWVDGARVVRELSTPEYRHAQAMLLRTFSAAWLAFALGLAATHDRVAAGIRRRVG